MEQEYKKKKISLPDNCGTILYSVTVTNSSSKQKCVLVSLSSQVIAHK